MDFTSILAALVGEVGKNKKESLIAPGEEFLKDPKKKQGWMIWAGETQSYTLADDGFQIVNGKATDNRPLYGINDSSVVLAGDKPQIMMADSPSTKYGNLSIGVITEKESKWFHDFSHIIATYDPGMMKYELSDQLLPDAKVFLDVVPLKNRAGFIAKIYANRKISLVWAYGGMSDGYHIDGQGGLPGGILSEECKENEILALDGFSRLKKPSLPKIILGGCSIDGEYLLCDSQSSDEPIALINSQPIDMPILAHITTVEENTPCYILISLADSEGEDKAIKEMLSNAHNTYTISIENLRKLQSQVVVDTPDDKLDMAVKGICISIDSCWRPPSFLHGALRWGSESGGWYLGWRGWYGSSAFGWHDRVKEAIKFHSQFQLQTPEEGPDSRGKVAPFVSFSRSVGGGYDMTQIYLDHIYYHYHWTGDKDLMKEIFPTIKLALEWEKREFAPDDDGLYENYANTFISDGHWYSGGGCTQASAYNYRANLMAAEIALLAGDDPTPYKEEAEKIRKAVNSVLWLNDKGYFAEYKDLLGLKRIHDAAEAPTIYHPIDFYLTDDFQSYQALRYIENRLWKEKDLILVNDWYPVIVTNGTIVFTETLNTILCYYRIGEVEKAYRLLKSCINPFYQARVPGTISCYGGTEAQQGTYVDFNDAVSMFGRVIVEGLFGILPKMQEQTVTVQPGFPLDWNEAKIKTPDIEYEYKRENLKESLHIVTTKPTKKILRLIAKQDRIEKVTLDGEDVEYKIKAGVGKAFIVVETPKELEAALHVTYRESTHSFSFAPVVERAVALGEGVSVRCVDTTPSTERIARSRLGAKGKSYEVFAHSCELLELNDPQGVLSDIQLNPGVLKAQINASVGHHTFFILAKNGDVSFWQPVDLEVREPLDITDGELLISKTERGKVLYSFTLRNNLAYALNLEVTSRFLEDENTESITISPYSSHAFAYKLKEISALTPGTNNLSLSIKGDKVKTLNVPIRFWSVFQGLPSLREDFLLSLVFVPLDYNDRIEDIFTHDYTSPRSPYSSLEIDIHGLNAWTGSWYKTDYVNTEHIKETLDDNGIFTSDIGVPFKQVREGNNGAFVSLWDNFPAEIVIPVNRKAKKAYLLIAGSTHNAQSYIENGEITVSYSDGTKDVVELFNPLTYDSMFQHFSENYPQWIGGAKDGYYGVGTASGIHADILDIPLADKMVERIHLKCLSNEVIIGLLGLTLKIS